MSLSYLARLVATYLDYVLGRPVLRYPPFHVFLEITSACNLRCRMCPCGQGADACCTAGATLCRVQLLACCRASAH